MPTTVTKTIGNATRDYTTIQAWADACPSNLVTVDQIWEGHLYPEGPGADGEWAYSSAAFVCSFGNVWCDATRYLKLRAAPGHAWYEHAQVNQRAFRYDRTMGVAVRHHTSNYYGCFATTASIRIHVDGIQMAKDNSIGSGVIWQNSSAGSYLRMTNCIGWSNTYTNLQVHSWYGVAINSLFYFDKDLTAISFVNAYEATSSAPTLVNCTIVCTGGSSTHAAVSNGYNTQSYIKNCAVFGFSDFVDTDANFDSTNSTHNATNLSSTGLGSSNQTSLTASSQFISVTTGAEDFRIRADGALDGNGTRAQTYTSDLDAMGRARSTSAPSIGAFEYSGVYEVVRTVEYTGADYTTQEAAYAAIPSNLTTLGVRWTIELGESASGNNQWGYSAFNVTQLSLGTSVTTSSTCYITLRPKAGKSFRDHADKLTNALRANNANGVAIEGTADYSGTVLAIDAPWTRVENMQFKVLFGTIAISVNAEDCTIKNTIAEQSNNNSNTVCIAFKNIGAQPYASGSRLINCVVIGNTPTITEATDLNGGRPIKFHSCTFVQAYVAARPGNGCFAYSNPYAAGNTLNGCAFFGYEYLYSPDGVGATSNHNATDLTWPNLGPASQDYYDGANWGANSLQSLALSSQFENATTGGSFDLRVKSGSALIGAGSPDSANDGVDILGQTRSGTAPTIGAFEYISPPGLPASSATVVSTASGTLTTGINLAGAAVGAATAQGWMVSKRGRNGPWGGNPWGMMRFQLTSSTPPAAALEGAASAVATAAAALQTSIALAGSASVIATALGDLKLQAALAGAAQGISTVAGAITAGILFAGAAGGIATATAPLSTGIQLAGAVAGISTASGGISTTITFAGSAQGIATAAAPLTAAIQMAGTAQNIATMAGALLAPAALEGASQSAASMAAALTAAIQLSGAATASATMVAPLTAQVQLAGAASGTATMAAGITAQIQLSAAALAAALMSASLSSSINLVGAAGAVATAAASLTTQPAGLAGSPASVATMAGALDAFINLLGQATSQATGQASLSASITMSGAALVQALATATLTTGTGISGAAAAAALASGTLSAQIMLAGQAIAASLASGPLTAQVLMQGVAAANSLMQSNLTATIRFNGSMLSQADAAGNLTANINLTGAMLAQAVAGAAVTTGIALQGAAGASSIASATLISTVLVTGTLRRRATYARLVAAEYSRHHNSYHSKDMSARYEDT